MQSDSLGHYLNRRKKTRKWQLHFQLHRSLLEADGLIGNRHSFLFNDFTSIIVTWLGEEGASNFNLNTAKDKFKSTNYSSKTELKIKIAWGFIVLFPGRKNIFYPSDKYPYLVLIVISRSMGQNVAIFHSYISNSS